MPLSLLTLVRNRTALLHDLARTLDAAPDPPAELVVAVCGGDDPRPNLPTTGFPIHLFDVEGAGERIPYSPARNACARRAVSSHLLFLDADCFPLPGALSAFDHALNASDALCIGEVLYLPPGCPATPAAARERGRPHPARPAPPDQGWTASDRHELAWGLCMGFRKTTFERLGGFDEGYGGYAGEDTDLAVAARSEGVPLHVVAGATVAHRHHDVFEPPLQQMTATLANAQRFRDRWGRWPMEGWLRAFAEMDLIAWSPEAPHARVLREPTPSEVEAARQRSALPFRV